MIKTKTKTIIKWLVLGYLIYLLYNLPKSSWDQLEIIKEEEPDGRVTRYVPGRTSYIIYIKGWWKLKMKTIGFTGILDQYILAPMGITFDKEK